jgi:uncharacterized membrane protein
MNGEFWTYLGIALMAVSAVIAVISIVIFKITGRRLKKKLEKDYGKLKD